jgi:hypothetical protein
MQNSVFGKKPKMGVTDLLNDWMHTTIGAFISYHVWWVIVSLISFPVSLLFLGLSFLIEGVRYVVGHGVVEKSKRSKKLVVISGCDTGFGKELSVYLSQHCGYRVLSGCLQKESIKGLEKLGGENLTATSLDVTSEKSVEDFVKFAETMIQKEGNKGLSIHAVVNNAGVANGGAVDWLSMKQLRFDMDV